MTLCFNPCCFGFGASSFKAYQWQILTMLFQSLLFWIWCFFRKTVISTRMANGVSILVVLDLVLLLKAQNLNTKITRCFNPCCFGFGASSLLIIPYTSHVDTCFNPCCFGFGASSRRTQVQVLLCPLFQSLLFWIWCFFTVLADIGGISIDSFNPCCFGFGASSSLHEVAVFLISGFNPCCFGFGASSAD